MWILSKVNDNCSWSVRGQNHNSGTPTNPVIARVSAIYVQGVRGQSQL